MRYVASLYQCPDGSVNLTLFRGQKRYRENITAEQALELAYALMSFASSQKTEPFYLLDKGVKL